MKLLTLCAGLTLLVTGCAAPPNTPGAGSGQSYTPIIDMQGVDPARHSADLAACRSYAGSVDAQAESLGGAFAGALLAGALNSMLGGNKAGNMQAANAGGLLGVTGAGTRALGKQERVITNCMALRGYRTLDGGTVAPVAYAPMQQSGNATAPANNQAIFGSQLNTPTVASAPLGTEAVQAELFAKRENCSTSPSVKMAAKGAGFETYSVACANGDTIMVRCEFGNCRSLK